MVNKTKISDDELIKILGFYNLGKYIKSTPLTGGTVQTNIKLETTKGRFVFRYYENRTKESVAFETNLLDYLKEQNYPCPIPIKSICGDNIGIHHQKPYVIFKFMEGHHIEEPNKNQKNQLIQKIAELHILCKNFSPIHKEDRMNYSVELCHELVQYESKRIGTTNSKEKFKWLEKELHNLTLPDSLPKGICHTDLHFSNILYKNGEFKALIDFDDANVTFLLFDLVVLMEYFAWRHDIDNVLNVEEAHKVIKEYEKYRPLSVVEKEHLFDVYKLSILIDCVWYFDRGNADDFYEKRKIDHLNQLGRKRFHQQLFG